eukprot:3385131-Karenia_brevis.AAC.1
MDLRSDSMSNTTLDRPREPMASRVMKKQNITCLQIRLSTDLRSLRRPGLEPKRPLSPVPSALFPE